VTATLVGFLLFLVYAEDVAANYSHHMAAPLAWLHPYLIEPTLIKLRGVDILMLFILLGSKPPKPAYAKPMKNAVLTALWTTVFFLVWGMIRGGEFRFASWQVYLIMSTVLVTFTVAAACKTPRDFVTLAKWLLAVAIYRGVMCWISYFTWAKGTIGESGEYLTSHADSIVWVTSIMIVMVDMIDSRGFLPKLRGLVLILFFLGAIQFNSRRLAWVSLIMGLVMFYVLYPEGKQKKGIRRFLLALTPLILVYVGVGWGRPEKIFLPLASFSSVSTKEDSSTLARNAENLSLIFTANTNNRLLGSGWGHPYLYLTLKYDISGFELWRYVPHNSILGVLAFTGIVGFTGFWLAIPTSVFLNTRIARLARDPVARKVGLIGVAQLIVCCNQLYGDMGIFDPPAMYTIAVSYAIAMRLSTRTGVWGPGLRPAPARAPARATAAPQPAA
jgi:hypothetical protein